MDPDAALEELLRLARINAEYGERWAELVLGLDEWIRGGGFLPQRWQEGQAKVTLKVKVK
jgi:hypothetical protein